MARYTTDKLRKAFEILQRSGKLDEVTKRLGESGFSVQVASGHSQALARELEEALKTLQQTDPEYYEEVMQERSKPRPERADPDCPC